MPAITHSPLPAELLNAADAIFAAGGYQEAAACYARLTVRYGNHDELAVRRFVALVANGDCDQAAVVVELASAIGQTLDSNSLPQGLLQLYGRRPTERKNHVEFLADYALKHPTDTQALKMVGIWLELDGQTERAQLFLKPAANIPAERGLTHNASMLVATRLSK